MYVNNELGTENPIDEISLIAKENDLIFIDYGISHMPQEENPLTPSKSLINKGLTPELPR